MKKNFSKFYDNSAGIPINRLKCVKKNAIMLLLTIKRKKVQ